MKTQSTARRAVMAVAGAALVAGALVPATASAQQYQGSYYDPCQRDQTGRQVVGAIVGGLAGMALGNNVVNDQRIDRWGRRRDNDTGATIGALVGAGVGANIGRNSAACTPARQAQPQPYYDYAPQYGYAPPPQDYYYDRYQDRRYDEYRYQDERYYDDRYYNDRSYDQRGACRMVESRIRMPDGRTETRMVQACPDSQGRYRIVD